MGETLAKPACVLSRIRKLSLRKALIYKQLTIWLMLPEVQSSGLDGAQRV
jgi:hypothetical protein